MESEQSPPRSHRSRYDDQEGHLRDQKSRRVHRDSHNDDREQRRQKDDSRIQPRRTHERSRSPRSPYSRRRSPRSRERETDRTKDRHRDGDRDSDRRKAHRGHSSRDDDRRDRRSGDKARKRDPDSDGEDSRKHDKQIVRRNGPLPSQADSFAMTNGEEPPKEKEKPNFGTSGALVAAANSVAQADGSTIVLKYHEPPEARKPSPKDQWRLFVFKGSDIIDTIELNGRTCWLIGRERTVIDIAADHPSISKQHAVIQFRYLEKRNEYGDKIGKVKPYLIDLDSANGTMLNSKKIPESRYLELKDKDLVQFGQSTREYVLMLAPKD